MATSTVYGRTDGNSILSTFKNDVLAVISGQLELADVNPSTDLGNVSGVLDLSDQIAPRALRMRLVGNVTEILLPTPDSAQSFQLTLRITQDGSGGRTINWPTEDFSYDQIDVDAAPNSSSLVSLLWDGVGWWGMNGNTSGVSETLDGGTP